MDKKNIKKKLFWLLLVTAVGLVGYWGYATHELMVQRDGLIADLASEQRKFKILQRKYAEEKAQVASLQRAKLSLEGKLRQVQQAMATIEEDTAKKYAEMEEGYKAEIAKLEARVTKYTNSLQKLKENRDQYKAKLAETVEIVKQRNKMIHDLRADKEDLTSNLMETTANLKRSNKHNRRLCQLSEELIEAYEKKGVGASLMQAEPFTKLKKVEIEKLMETYRDQIDDNNLELNKTGS